MRRVLVSLFLCLAAMACGESTVAPTLTQSATQLPAIVGLALSQDAPVLGRLGQLQVAATITRSDGTTEDVTATATWTSANPELVSVQRGLLIAVSCGIARVTVGYGGYLQTMDVTVRRNTKVTASFAVQIIVSSSAVRRIVMNFEGHALTDECYASTCYVKTDGSVNIDPGPHEVTATIVTSESGQRVAVSVVGDIVIFDGDTGEGLATISFANRSLELTSGVLSTWPVEVPSYR
jgi:hypothetical protein